MATYAKGTITFQPVVDQINRKFTTRKNKCTVNAGGGPVELIAASYMGAGTRITGRSGIGQVKKNYFFYRENPRMTAPSVDEVAQRTAFSDGLAWARAAAKDLAVITANQIKMQQLAANPNAYIVVGDENMYIYGYTFPGFMKAFGIKAAMADALPQDHNLPSVVVPA